MVHLPVLALVFLLAAPTSAPTAAPTAAPDWPTPVEGFVMPKPGEHPRLFFRKSDIPRLRERAKTPEGQAILKRLRFTLGSDGEALPTVFNPHPPVNIGAQGGDLPVGAFTNAHAAGYGFLHVLTGEQKYADMARQCLEWMFEGKSDRDERYTWNRPGAGLRVGEMLLVVAMAYDFCYDAWPQDFRRRVAREMVEYRKVCVKQGGWEGGKNGLTFERIVEPYYPPTSNHFGALVGGATVALLAVQGDPEVEPARVEKLLATAEKNVRRVLTQALGDGAFFAEGPGPWQMAVNSSLVPALQALKVAGGKDYLEAPNAKYLTLKWVMELLPDSKGRPSHPCRNPSSYGTERLERDGHSAGGQFAQGFGAIPERYKPALLWTYRQFVEPSEATEYPRLLPAGERSYDVMVHPHRGVLSFVNWPIGVEPRHPSELLSNHYRDTLHYYYVFRNQWRDADDAIVTFHLGGPRGFIRCSPGPIMVWGLGMRTTFPVRFGPARPSVVETNEHGGVISAPVRGGVCSVLVDFSRASGAEVLVAMCAPGLKPVSESKTDRGVTRKIGTATVGGNTFIVLTLGRGAAPELNPDGDRLRVGGLLIGFDGQRVTSAPASPTHPSNP